MTHWRTYVFIINLLLTVSAFAQPQDTTGRNTGFSSWIKETHLRLGYDLGKKIYSKLNGGNMDAAYLNLGYRNHILELFAGKEQMPFVHPSYTFVTTGTYYKIGYAYNFYENWGNMHNEITLGLRYGNAGFSYDLQRIAYDAPTPEMPAYVWTGHRSYSGLHAGWIEVGATLKAEIFHGVYLDLFLSGKRLLGGSKPDGFDLLYVPGFFRTNVSGFGFGIGYGISYRLGL